MQCGEGTVYVESLVSHAFLFMAEDPHSFIADCLILFCLMSDSLIKFQMESGDDFG